MHFTSQLNKTSISGIVATLVAVACAHLTPDVVGSETGSVYHKDLAKLGKIDSSLEFSGEHFSAFVRPDRRGLLVAIPPGFPKTGPIGVTARLMVRGDFEITVTYEILAIQPPRAGYGSGVGISIRVTSPTDEMLSLDRYDTPDQGPTFTSTHHTSDDSGKRRYQSQQVPARTKLGKLRLSRQAGTVHSSFTVGGEVFHPLREVELGEADVDEVRFYADTGGSGSSLKTILKDITIRADKIVLEPNLATMSRFEWLKSASFVVLISILVGGLVLRRILREARR